MLSVMEPIQTDYRLERWLALLLSLLFFLPFAARADDIVFATETYHGSDLPYRDGDEFLGLLEHGAMVPMKIAVKAVPDLGDQPGEASGREVSVAGYPTIYLVRGRNLRPGAFTSAHPNFSPLLPDVTHATFTLGQTPYDLSYRCGEQECTLVLEQGERSQDLVTVPIEREERGRINTLQVEQYIVFAGDLDRDGKLDLIANLARHWNEWRPVMLLSTSAKDGELVGLAAELPTYGC